MPRRPPGGSCLSLTIDGWVVMLGIVLKESEALFPFPRPHAVCASGSLIRPIGLWPLPSLVQGAARVPLLGFGKEKKWEVGLACPATSVAVLQDKPLILLSCVSHLRHITRALSTPVFWGAAWLLYLWSAPGDPTCGWAEGLSRPSMNLTSAAHQVTWGACPTAAAARSVSPGSASGVGLGLRIF